LVQTESQETPNFEEENLLQLHAEMKLKMKEHKKAAHHRRSNPHHDHKPNDHTDKLIELINTSNLGWKADPCKMQKHHSLYQKHCKPDDKLGLAQVNSDIDEERPVFGKGDGFAEALEKAQSFQKKYTDYKSIPDNELP
jgi:hypothetical protein